MYHPLYCVKCSVKKGDCANCKHCYQVPVDPTAGEQRETRRSAGKGKKAKF